MEDKGVLVLVYRESDGLLVMELFYEWSVPLESVVYAEAQQKSESFG